MLIYYKYIKLIFRVEFFSGHGTLFIAARDGDEYRSYEFRFKDPSSEYFVYSIDSIGITVAYRQLLYVQKIYYKGSRRHPLARTIVSYIAAATMAGVGYPATNTQMNVRDITKTVSRDRQIKRLLNALYLHTYAHRLTEHNALVRTIHILCTYCTRVLGPNVHSD